MDGEFCMPVNRRPEAQTWPPCLCLSLPYLAFDWVRDGFLTIF